jgi:hypothetical protein
VSLGLGAEEVFDGKQTIGDEINYWAVIIGISDYQGSDNDLPIPAKEAQSLYDLLQENDDRWDSTNMKLLLNGEATKQNILDALNWLKTNADDNDIVLFSYNGHGGFVEDDNGDELDGRDETIISWEHSDITDDELQYNFDEISDKNIDGMFLIFDCCLSGGLFNWRRALNNLYKINGEMINIFNKEIGEANYYTKQFTSDMKINNRVIVASSIPRGLAVCFNGDEGWFDFTTGIRRAIENGMKTAEDISKYAILWWLSQPEFFEMFKNPFYWIYNLMYLLEAGVIIMPLPILTDGYPVLHPRLGKLWILKIFGSDVVNNNQKSLITTVAG